MEHWIHLNRSSLLVVCCLLAVRGVVAQLPTCQEADYAESSCPIVVDSAPRTGYDSCCVVEPTPVACGAGVRVPEPVSLWNRIVCKDINECDDPDHCGAGDENVECENQVGAPAQCNCINPFVRDPDCGTCSAVMVKWYKQEETIDSYIKQSNLPALDALTLCFRFEPLVLDHTDAQGQTYVTSIFTTKKAWNLGIKTNPALAFGVSPNSYFTDGTNNKEENDLWKQKHMHCFVWEKKPGTFKWYVDVNTPGMLELFRETPSNAQGIAAGGTIIALQEQDTNGGGLNVNQLTPGWISQYNLYDSALDEETVLAMGMFCTDKGNVVSEDTFEIVGTMEERLELSPCSPCQSVTQGLRAVRPRLGRNRSRPRRPIGRRKTQRRKFRRLG